MATKVQSTPQQRAAIRRLRTQGLSIAAIATETGRSPRTVNRIVSSGANPISVAKTERNAAIAAAAVRGESYASIGRRFEISGKRASQIVDDAKRRQKLVMPSVAEPRAPARRPTKTEVEALYVAGGADQVLERWPQIGPDVLSGLPVDPTLDDDYQPEPMPKTLAPPPWIARAGAAVSRFFGFGRG